MIIDVHTHIFPEEIRLGRGNFFAGEPDFALLYENPLARLVSAEDLVGTLDSWGAQSAVTFGFPWNSNQTARLNNDYVLEAAKKHQGRLIPFACVNPLNGQSAIDEARRCVLAGAKGLGEIATYKAGLGEKVRETLAPLAELAAEAGIPILLHANEPVGHSYPGKSRMEPSDLYELIKAHPRVKWILAHWGGGLFFYMLQKKEVAGVLKNVWYDTSAGPYLYQPQIYSQFIAVAGVEKLLFGSDYPLLELARYQKDMLAANLSEEDVKKILGQNFEQMLKVDVA